MISIVIPCYHRKECVLELLRDIHVQEGADFEVIVVDDASPDDTAAAVQREFPQISLLVNESNGGPCVARNRGIRAARGEFVVGFDCDVTVPDHHLLAKVREAFAESPDASGFALRILSPDGRADDAPRWWHPVPCERGKDRRFETDYFSGTAYAFRREALIEAGLYPEILYMHYEEVELALRVLDAGGSIIYRPDLKVLHHANEVSRRSEIQMFYKPRNQVLLAISCFPFPKCVAYLAPRVVFQFFKALKGGHLADFHRAMSDAVARIRQSASSRKPLKKATLRKMEKLRTLHFPDEIPVTD
jgi:GT2 family glycosyltransferase